MAVYRQLRKDRCDIALLQETYVVEDDVKKWSAEWGGVFEAVTYNKHSRGLIICVKKV